MKPSAPASATTTSGLKPALLYAVLALAGGATLAVIVPPLQAPDEWMHFARAYQVADGGLLPRRNREGQAGGVLPSSVEASLRAASTTLWHREAKIKQFGSQFTEFEIPLDPSHTSFSTFPKTAVEPPFAYLPQALGIRVARMVSGTVVGALMGARLGNLLLVVAVIAWAIYMTPIFRWVLAFMALSPLSLSVAGTATSYGFTYAVIFLFLAIFLRVAYRPTPPISWRTIAGLVLATLALGLVIPGYFPLVLLYLLIPAARLGSRKRYWLNFAVLVVIALGCGAAWVLVVGRPHTPESLLTMLTRQLLEHPREFGETLLRAIGPPLPFLAKTFGGPLVTDALNIGHLLAIGYAILMFLIALLDVAPNAGRISLAQRVIPLAAAVLGVLTVSLGMYLTWPPTYFDQGIHPRQVIPLACVALLFFLNAMPRVGGFGRFAREHLGWIAALYFVLRMAETLWAVYQRFYDLSS